MELGRGPWWLGQDSQPDPQTCSLHTLLPCSLKGCREILDFLLITIKYSEHSKQSIYYMWS